MRVIHLEFSKLGVGMSGGESCMLAFIRYLIQRGIRSILCTTDNAYNVYTGLGLGPGPYLEYRIIDSYDFEKRHHPFVSYLHRTPKALRLVKDVPLQADDVILCHNSFLPNALPCRALSRRRPEGVRIIHWLHMLAPSIWRGYEGEFTGKHQFPRPNVMHLAWSQTLQGRLLPRDATVLVDNPYFADRAERMFNGHIHVLKHFGIAEKCSLVDTAKEFDLVWMGRFHPQKGLLDAVEVFRLVHAAKPDARMLIIGGGDKNQEREITRRIAEYELTDAVHRTGVLMGAEKDAWLRKASLFLMTSTYEGLPLTIMEVFSLGLPIVAYDLPVYVHLGNSLLLTPTGNWQRAAMSLLELLDAEKHLHAKSVMVYRVAQQNTTVRMGAEIVAVLRARETGRSLADGVPNG